LLHWVQPKTRHDFGGTPSHTISGKHISKNISRSSLPGSFPPRGFPSFISQETGGKKGVKLSSKLLFLEILGEISLQRTAL
jgi:hypothetical protein